MTTIHVISDIPELPDREYTDARIILATCSGEHNSHWKVTYIAGIQHDGYVVGGGFCPKCGRDAAYKPQTETSTYSRIMEILDFCTDGPTVDKLQKLADRLRKDLER